MTNIFAQGRIHRRRNRRMVQFIQLEKCLSIAKKQGFESVYGIVLHENRNMLALGKKLGFEIKRDADSEDNELVIHLGGNRP